MGEEVVGYLPPDPPPAPRRVSFYRYVRPVRFDTKRFEFNTLPRGGICLRFDQNPEGSLTFSFARCHADDHFNRNVARQIADQRMKVLMSREDLWHIASVPMTSNTEELVQSVIYSCRTWPTEPEHHLLVVRYMSIEWLGLADQLERLVVANQQEEEKARHYLTAAGALELAAAYSALQANVGS